MTYNNTKLGNIKKPDRHLKSEYGKAPHTKRFIMIITRWQAPLIPDKEQIKNLFSAEGLEPFEELTLSEAEIPEHRHPFDEVRMVASGELLLNISGNQLLLRSGDRIIIPANTKHSHKSMANAECLCICANKIK